MRYQQRRERFVEWFAATYGPDSAEGRARFMADSARRGEPAYTKGRVSQFLDADQPFGERAALNLAQRFGLPADFFERPATVGRLVDLFLALDEDSRNELLQHAARLAARRPPS